MLVQHFQVLTEAEMTVLNTQGNTALSLEKLLASSKSTRWSKYIDKLDNTPKI